MIKNVLFPVRDDHDLDWAISFVKRLHQREPVCVHLLSVRAPLDGHVRMFFSSEQISGFYREDGEAALRPVREALERAGVSCVSHVAVGNSAAVIAEYARKYHCPQIVMGPMRSGLLSLFALGSLGRQIEHLLQSSGEPCEVL